jgi:multidrug efflux pump subunit AcrA (membrane-fusion protein)
MKRCIGILQLTILALVVGLGIACQGKTTASPTPTPSDSLSVPPGGAEEGSITTRGIIRPAGTLQLGFITGGVVHSVTAHVGLTVKAGEPLAELDTTALEFELGKARETVALREAALEGLLDGPETALVERAEAEHAQQVAQAEIALQVARWELERARLQEQADPGAGTLAVTLAQSKLEQLELQLAQARALSPAAEVVAAQVGLARAQDALDTARAEYQKALDRSWEPQEVRDATAKAVWHAEQELELAQARLDGALDAQRAHALGLEVLAAQRAVAALQLTQTLKASATYTITLALLEADVDRAQLQLDGLRTWQNPYRDPPPPDEVAQARALSRQAELTVEELEWQLEGAQLTAPFEGVVAAVPIRPGEWAAPGATVVELLDLSRWHVETMNVSELQIGRVKVGQEVRVRVNAFPGETLGGHVIAISPVAVVQQGDTTYTLTIELEPTELNLRAGMTVQVEILTD